jgi:hypothetical protein
VGLLEQHRQRRIAVALIAGGLALAAAATWYVLRERPAGGRAGLRRIPGDEGARVVVEVLNATRSLGLARTATHRLRDAGLDVVAFGSDTGAVLDSTQVLVRRGAPEAGERVAKALGAGRPRALPDPGRLVDVTVRLGRDFAARVGARPGEP